MLKPYTVLASVLLLLLTAEKAAYAQPVSAPDQDQPPEDTAQTGEPSEQIGPPAQVPQPDQAPSPQQGPARPRPDVFAKDAYLQKTIGLGLSYANSTTRSVDDSLYNEVLIDISTRNDLGSFYGLYSDSSIGGARHKGGKVFFGHLSEPRITPALSSSTGAAVHLETRFGVDYILDFRKLKLDNLKIRCFFGPSLGLLEAREYLSVRIGTSSDGGIGEVKNGETTIFTIGWHLGLGLDYHTRDKKMAVGSSLFFDTGYHYSSFRNFTESTKNTIPSSKTTTAYVGGEFSLFARHRVFDQTYIQLTYDLDMENTALPLSARRHKIGLSIVFYR